MIGLWLLSAVLAVVILPVSDARKPDDNKENASKAPVATVAPTSRADCVVVVQNGVATKCEWADQQPASFYRRLFTPENSPNMALVMVGAAGIIVAISTLTTIKRQTTATEKAASAALLNAQIIIDAERAWISVTPHIFSPSFYPLRESGAPIPENLVDVLPIAHKFRAKLVNVGKTPARIESIAIRYVRTAVHPSKWNEQPDYGEMTASATLTFPNTISTIDAELSPEATMTQSQIDEVQNGREFLYAFGIVKYSNVYGNNRETRFGYLYQVQDTHFVMKDGTINKIRTGKAHFRTGGPPAYNQAT